MNGALLLIFCVLPAGQPDFAGWQAMRVIHHEGYARRAYVADILGDGRDQIILANTRHSRLEIYTWLPADQRKEPRPVDADHPNALPMAPEFKKTNVPMEQLPLDVAAHDIDGDGQLELVALVATPNRLIAFKRGGDGVWSKHKKWDLLDGKIAATGRAILFIDGVDEVLVSFAEGIQSVALKAGVRADWLRPRERHSRVQWWRADVDGDGRTDLIEWTRQTNQTIRWYRRSASGWLPAQVLYENAVNHATVLSLPGQTPQVFLLAQLEMDLLRRFEIGFDESDDLGTRQPLPLDGGERTAWCGMMLGEQRAIVWRDSSQPRLNTCILGDDGWGKTSDFPSVNNVKALASLPGKLLLWAKDASDLYVSRWDGSRLTFPKPVATKEKEKDRRMIVMDRAGNTVWWVQRVGEHVDLYTQTVDAPAPTRTRFEKVGKKIDKAVWIGGKRLLLREAYKKQIKLAVIKDGKTFITEPAHLKKATLDEFGLFTDGDRLRAARITDGVLQWLDDDMQPVDQIMLPQGRQLISYVPLSEGSAWALQSEGKYVHRLKPDKAGIPRVTESIELGGGTDLGRDPVLGLMFAGGDQVVRLTPGRSHKLKLLQTIQSSIGRPGAVTNKDASIHRVGSVDLDGDGRDEVLLLDDQRHQIIALRPTEKGMQPLITWPVFEDKAYPYGYSQQQISVEPRVVVSCNLDGDGHRDLVMLCHDRLLIYLGRESQ